MMDNQQIIFVEPNVTRLVDNQVADLPAENQVLVRTEYTAVSAGTERANLVGELQVNGSKVLEEAVFPRAFGYSGSGTVEAVGPGVTSVAPGDRVVIYFGKHSRWNLMSEDNVHRIEDEAVASADAALIVIAGFSLAAIRKTRVEIGEAAMVTGLGILGLIAVQLLRAGGATPIVAADLRTDRRELGGRLGADLVLDPTDSAFVQVVRKASAGRGINVAVEVTGVCAGLNATLECMAQFGRIALLGCTRDPDCSVDFYHGVHYPGVTLVGANNFARPRFESSPGNWTFADDCRALLGLMASRRLDLGALISETHAPEAAPQVYDRLAHSRESFPVGVLFDWTNAR